MLQALTMEREAVARYGELADTMAAHNNVEVAALFRRMAEYEARHVAQILADMGWSDEIVAPRRPGFWTATEPPESVPLDEAHYLMHPWHALRLALAAERRAHAFFARMAAGAANVEVRRAAEALRDEEAEHVALVEAWLAKVPEPAAAWADDPDPPRHSD
jgi:rubrerythrin